MRHGRCGRRGVGHAERRAWSGWRGRQRGARQARNCVARPRHADCARATTTANSHAESAERMEAGGRQPARPAAGPLRLRRDAGGSRRVRRVAPRSGSCRGRASTSCRRGISSPAWLPDPTWDADGAHCGRDDGARVCRGDEVLPSRGAMERLASQLKNARRAHDKPRGQREFVAAAREGRFVSGATLEEAAAAETRSTRRDQGGRRGRRRRRRRARGAGRRRPASSTSCDDARRRGEGGDLKGSPA